MTVVSVQAEMTKLGSARTKGLSDIASAATAISIMAGQPMVGMMAMGSLQQASSGAFGLVDQAKPFAAIVYTKAPLPSIADAMTGQNPEALASAKENLAFAVMVPITQKPADYLVAQSATNQVNGVNQAENGLFVVCQDGYAIYANDPAAAKRAAGEMKSALVPKLNNMAIEITVGKPVISAYADFFAFAEKSNTNQLEALAGFAKPFANYQKAQMEMVKDLLPQIEEFSCGVNYDITAGYTMDIAGKFAKGSELGNMFAKAKSVNDSLYAVVPPQSDFFMLAGSVSDLSYDSKVTLKSVSETLVPAIPDEALRATAQSAVQDLLWVCNNAGEVVAFLDRDKNGKMAVVSKFKTSDNAQYETINKSLNATVASLLEKYVPGQKFFAYDQKAGRGFIDYAAAFDFAEKKLGKGAPADPEMKAKVLLAVNAIVGSNYTYSVKNQGEWVVQLGKSPLSDYTEPAAFDGTALAARIKEIMPKNSTAKPIEVVSVSLGSIIKHYGTAVLTAIGVKDEALTTAFASLPDAPAGAITMVVWSEKGILRETVNFSAAECKGLVTFFTALSARQSAQYEDAGDEDEDDGASDDEDDSDTNAVDSANATPEAT